MEAESRRHRRKEWEIAENFLPRQRWSSVCSYVRAINRVVCWEGEDAPLRFLSFRCLPQLCFCLTSSSALLVSPEEGPRDRWWGGGGVDLPPSIMVETGDLASLSLLTEDHKRERRQLDEHSENICLGFLVTCRVSSSVGRTSWF